MKARVEKGIWLTESQYQQLQFDIAESTLKEGAQQGIAAVLYALSLHGYGSKRLQDILGWAQEILLMPPVFNRQVTADDVLNNLCNKYGCEIEKLEFQIDPDYSEEAAKRAMKKNP